MASPPHTTPAPLRPAAALARLRGRTLPLGLLAVFGLALALRLYRLGAQSLWLDEGATWAEVTRQGWGRLLADLLSPDAAYPLYHLLLKAWVAAAGDSEWALRLPSALAGAVAVAALVLAAAELSLTDDRRPTTNDHHLLRFSILNAQFSIFLLALSSPYAIWHAQDAKVYSALIAVEALVAGALLRALRLGGRRGWLPLAGLLLLSLFVHRLAALSAAGALLALAWTRLTLTRHPSPPHPSAPSPFHHLAPWLLTAALLLGAGGVYGLTRAVGGGWQETGHIAAGPLAGLWLTLAHFSLDRGDLNGYLGLPLLVWALPALALTLWGLGLLVRDALGGRPAARALLALLAAPLGLFALALALAPNFEPRYVAVAFPAWLLTLAYPFADSQVAETVRSGDRGEAASAAFVLRPSSFVGWGRALCLLGALAVNAAALLQPQHGLFSGAPVKEQWRAAVRELADQIQPDDLLVLHPYYALPLWDYYAPRVTPDPLPRPVLFTDFSQGFCAEQFRTRPEIRDCFRRQNERQFLEKAYGAKRAWLLIAPEHAATIDRPKTLDDLRAELRPGETPPAEPDRYGWIGLRFQFPQRTWPCGGETLVGVELKCQSYPSFFGMSGPASIPEPAVRLEARFGGELLLRGYTILPPGGALRGGGTLPITLYWTSLRLPARDYRMFLHLCRDCGVPPLAQNDRPPLNGYEPAGLTTWWEVADPVHDERGVPLRDSAGAPLPPGRYTLLLGVYPLDNPAAEARLPVQSSAPVQDGNRVVLGEVSIQ